ncbi:MAG: FAD:protein FMN transferase [Acidimicrobiia bacterium]
MPGGVWSERRFRAMGSTAHVVVLGTHLDRCEHALDWAEQEAGRLESRWSRFRPDSDVSRCNREAGASATAVAPETFALVERAVTAWRATGGRFDPTVLHALEAAGYDATFEVVRSRPQTRTVVSSAPPGHAAIDVLVDDVLRGPVTPTPGCAGIVLDPDRGTVSLPAGVGLDLGGIGKGAAADLIAEGLVARGVDGACVAMGGDVRAAGAVPDGTAWPIPVEHPFDHAAAQPRTLFTVPLRDAGVVTSTRLIHRWVHDGVRRHHVIDPSTGHPADRGVTAVIVRADTAWWAESLAKAALVAGVADGLDLLTRQGVQGWVVDDDGRVWAAGDAGRLEGGRVDREAGARR